MKPGTAILALSSLVQKSVTTDEITYIAAGSYHLRVTVTDQVSGQSRARIVPLEVLQLTR